MKLFEEGITMNHKKISRIMKKYHLQTKVRKKNPYRMIMKRSPGHKIFMDKLKRHFSQMIPYTVFCTDITYLPYDHRFAYLSVTKDIASGEIVGWYLSAHLGMEIVLHTIENMKKNIPKSRDIMIHSDQGGHYSNPSYVAEIKKLHMVQSMSRKGNCIDNAPIESFFGHMKDEIEYKECTTFDQVLLRISTYMRYYNNQRPQWNLKRMTPVAYRDHLLEKR